MDRSNELKVVIVENDPIIALDIGTCLMDEGFDVVDTLSNHGAALTAARTNEADIFTLDYSPEHQSSEPIAAVLNDRNIPFIVISGSTEKARTLNEFRNRTLIAKPFRFSEISKAITFTLE